MASGTLSDFTTEGAEAEGKTGPYELTYTHNSSLAPVVGEYYRTGWIIIRSVDELETFRGGKISENWAKYDDAFFEEHSLIAVQLASSDPRCRALPGRLARGSDGVYTLQVYSYTPEVVMEVDWSDSFVIEVDEALPADVELELSIEPVILSADDYNTMFGWFYIIISCSYRRPFGRRFSVIKISLP